MPPFDIITVISQLPTVVMVVLAGWAHFKGIWRWGKDCTKIEVQNLALTKAIDDIHAANAAKLAKLEMERDIYLRLPSSAPPGVK